MRALWTAASGMKAQQLNVDVISNNISNVNTTGFKSQKTEFKDLLYTYSNPVSNEAKMGQPVNLQVGHGVMPVATSRIYTTGSADKTDNPTDLAMVQGNAFFVVEDPNAPGEEAKRLYTRDGSFKFSVEDNQLTLVTSQGEKVLTTDDGYVQIPENSKDFAVSQNGTVTAKSAEGELLELGQLKTVTFVNPEGLKAVGSNFYVPTDNSGEPVQEENETRESKIYQGYLEMSNVQLVDEMVRMITAQRAYEINSKTVQTADDMLNTINQLKRQKGVDYGYKYFI